MTEVVTKKGLKMEFILIEDTNQEFFEKQINDFIKKNSKIEIIDYQYSTCMVDYGKDIMGSDIHYSILIRYKLEEEK